MSAFVQRFGGRVVVAAFVGLLLANPASAQQAEISWVEPGLTLAAEAKPWAPWLTGALFLVAVMAISLKNPHRSHLD